MKKEDFLQIGKTGFNVEVIGTWDKKKFMDTYTGKIPEPEHAWIQIQKAYKELTKNEQTKGGNKKPGKNNPGVSNEGTVQEPGVQGSDPDAK